jgi:hypothetical protein
VADTFFTTGAALLPDTGSLEYNGCTFSTLFHSRLQGVAVKDNAGRTVKYVEYRLIADGIVTIGLGNTIDNAMITLRQKLNQQGGTLIYTGRGFGNLIVNPPGGKGGIQDVAWGPVPETFDFVPLGNGRSAAVTWGVTMRLAEWPAAAVNPLIINRKLGVDLTNLLQFNEEISVSYNTDGYSTFSINGTMEIAQTRSAVGDRSVSTSMLEEYRESLMNLIGSRIDLTRFYLPTRRLEFSRDRRTMEWSFSADEQAPMGNPPWATQAHGNFSVRPLGPGMSIVNWVCNMRCTYVIRKDFDRNNAWRAFILLVRTRMAAHQFGKMPDEDVVTLEGQIGGFLINSLFVVTGGIIGTPFGLTGVGAISGDLAWEWFFKNSLGPKAAGKVTKVARPAQVWAFHWGLDEGIYMDSKSVSFEVSWRLMTTYDTVLKASGFLRQSGIEGGDIWAASMKDIVGGTSWLFNSIGGDVIVDFGGGQQSI